MPVNVIRRNYHYNKNLWHYFEAGQAAKDYGADLIGFVFAPSRRRIEVAAAENLASQIHGIGKVGVFVDAPLTEVQEIAKRCKLDYVQLHGNESQNIADWLTIL